MTQEFLNNSGRLTSMVDANGNTTRFIHNLTNDTEVVIDRLGRTNTAVYDTRGNVTAGTTNAPQPGRVNSFNGNNNKTNQVVFANGQPYATNNFAFNPATLLLTATPPIRWATPAALPTTRLGN